MNLDPTFLFAGMLLSSIAGYAMYGKRQSRAVALFCGILLCVLPMLIGQLWLLMLICSPLLILPFVLRY